MFSNLKSQQKQLKVTIVRQVKKFFRNKSTVYK